MVCAAYLCSIVGFDVHTDGHDGRTYVVSLLQGISCERIHHDDVCSCCHNHNDEDDDCTDDIKMLTVSGSDDDGIVVIASPQMVLLETFLAPSVSFSAQRRVLMPSGISPPREALSKFSILRV